MKSFTELPDLANERVGGVVLAANDEFFAPKENLNKAGPPVWLDDEYTERGKWMDGWETRRRREPGNDWALVRLGLAGDVRGVVVDTSNFRGNYPESCSIDGCAAPDGVSLEQLTDPDAEGAVAWRELLPQTMLDGNARNLFPVTPTGRITHMRLNIYPDGGIARLRVHGYVTPDWDRLDLDGAPIDLAAFEFGGLVLACNDESLGSASQLLMPGAARNMRDGWQTRRRRGQGHDWAILQLGAPGAIDWAVIDTSHFIGNAPSACTLEWCVAEVPDPDVDYFDSDACQWRELLPRTDLTANRENIFEDELRPMKAATHVRLGIYPDGGVARARLFGTTERARSFKRGLSALNQLDESLLRERLDADAGASDWSDAVIAGRPFGDLASLFQTVGQASGDERIRHQLRELLLEL